MAKHLPPRGKPPRRVLTDTDYEQIREQLDDHMLGNAMTAHIVREHPLSQKHKNNPLRAARTKKARPR